MVVLDTRLDDTLRDLGYLRELLNRIQTARKEMGLEFVDRIRVRLEGSDRAVRIAKAHAATLRRECLAVAVTFGCGDGAEEAATSSEAAAGGAEAGPALGEAREVDLEGDKVQLRITKA